MSYPAAAQFSVRVWSQWWSRDLGAVRYEPSLSALLTPTETVNAASSFVCGPNWYDMCNTTGGVGPAWSFDGSFLYLRVVPLHCYNRNQKDRCATNFYDFSGLRVPDMYTGFVYQVNVTDCPGCAVQSTLDGTTFYSAPDVPPAAFATAAGSLSTVSVSTLSPRSCTLPGPAVQKNNICNAPTFAPTTDAPSEAPTPMPSTVPTAAPSPIPSAAPTARPTAVPSAKPSASPTRAPTTRTPTSRPTALPTPGPGQPTLAPSESPTPAPSLVPTAPSEAPTSEPTAALGGPPGDNNSSSSSSMSPAVLGGAAAGAALALVLLIAAVVCIRRRNRAGSDGTRCLARPAGVAHTHAMVRCSRRQGRVAVRCSAAVYDVARCHHAAV